MKIEEQISEHWCFGYEYDERIKQQELKNKYVEELDLPG